MGFSCAKLKLSLMFKHKSLRRTDINRGSRPNKWREKPTERKVWACLFISPNLAIYLRKTFMAEKIQILIRLAPLTIQQGSPRSTHMPKTNTNQEKENCR